ncbi:MAG: paraquat-inducible protein A [Sneathiella sp.]
MNSPQTALNNGVIACHTCHSLTLAEKDKNGFYRCSRCHSRISSRKPNSLNRTWAFLIAAVILYIPANIFPIMTVVSFGKENSDTILSGIFYLMDSGQWVIGLVVFFASIFVPIFKITALSFLALSVQLKFKWQPKTRTILYRIVDAIGRWSMIDVFMISILIALVKLKALATVEAEPGAIAFAGVVILTMFAAMTFDPRLIWDQVEDTHND